MPAITRWDPFRDLVAIQDQMNRMFDDRVVRGRESELPLSHWMPPVDVFEDAEGVTITAELPGVDPRAVEVKVEDGTLTVTGERKLEREDRRESYHRIERSYGSFMRSFTLPTTLEVDKIKAEHKNGVLRVFLPKREETKPKKISVKVD